MNLEIFHPGYRYPIRICSVAGFAGQPDSWAVFRPTYSRRGNTCNATRYKRASFAGAYALALKPLGPKTVSRL